ncbi:MAG: hypothetical protein GTO24_28385 [candidate division Zixibacteria bacterium]|nr:hypothetical protein [candidate division Zixibacteria bacterium]
MIDIIISHLAATVKSFVDDDGLLMSLREEIALKVGMSQCSRVRHINISDTTVRSFIHFLQVSLDPIAIPKSAFIPYRHD